MDEATKLKVKAYKAFLEIYEKLEISPYQLDPHFLEQVLYHYAPLGYIETHYNHYHDIRQYTLAPPQLHVFETALEIRSAMVPGKDYPLPTTFIGDVYVKGNLEIAFDNTVFILGNLIVDKVLTCNSDVRLIVGGSIQAKGMEVDTTLLDFSICAEKIEVSDVLYTRSFMYAGAIQSKLILAEENFQQLTKSVFSTLTKTVSTPVLSTYFFSLPLADRKPIKALFKPGVLKDTSNNPPLWKLTDDIFYALKDDIWVFDENDDYTIINNIFVE